MKSILPALLLSLALSACAGFSASSPGSTAAPSAAAGAPSQDNGVRDATRDYPYNPSY